MRKLIVLVVTVMAVLGSVGSQASTGAQSPIPQISSK